LPFLMHGPVRDGKPFHGGGENRSFIRFVINKNAG
jgi:hypothetical protein